MTRTIKSFSGSNNIKTVNEGIFDRKLLAKKSGFTWKDQGNGNYIVKILNQKNIVDLHNNLTDTGKSYITNALNSDSSFTQKLDDRFFKDNLIVYTVKSYAPGKQKIQLTVTPRTETDEKLNGFNYVSAKELNDPSLIRRQDTLVRTDDTSDKETETKSEYTTDSNEVISDDFAGREFKYDMKTLGMANFKILDNGAFYFSREVNPKQTGRLDYMDEKIYMTKETGFSDSGKTFTIIGDDLDVFIRMFLDREFLKGILGIKDKVETKKDDGEEMKDFDDMNFTVDNIQSFLYDKDNRRIFPS